MKILFKFLIAIAIFFALEKLIRTQTHAFRIEKTQFDTSYKPEWEVSHSDALPEVLQQPFHFLGSGVQCYAFLSEDGTTVLKIFKHYHLWPSSKILEKLPLPSFLENWRLNVLKKRQQRISTIFSSALLAYQQLASQTGVFYLNLNPTVQQYPTLTLYDKIGIRYSLDLNQTPFLLQKKVDLIFPYLKKHPSETKNIIDSFLNCLTKRTMLGIANQDPLLYRNFGILDGKVIEIDIGSFVLNPYLKNSLFSKRQLFYETLEFKEWIKRHVPEHSEYFEEKLLQAVRS